MVLYRIDAFGSDAVLCQGTIMAGAAKWHGFVAHPAISVDYFLHLERKVATFALDKVSFKCVNKLLRTFSVIKE